MDAFLDDMRFALRSMLRRPLFNGLVIAVLALGIGATSAMFAVVKGALLSAPPFRDPDRVMALFAPQPEVPKAPLSGPDFLDWQRDATSFERMALAKGVDVNLSIGDEPTRLAGFRVSGDYFRVLGSSAAHGRLLDAEDDHLARRVAVISHRAFLEQFGGDPAVVGSTILIDREPHEIVGVLAEEDELVAPFSRRTDVALPYGTTAANAPAEMSQRGNHTFLVLAKLKEGATPAGAQDELVTIAARLEADNPNSNARVTAKVVPLTEELVGDARGELLLLFGAIAFVLLLACANAASLLLSRGAGRRGELALRASLGATRRRLVRQLVTESATLGLAGAAIGALASLWILDLLLEVLRGSLPATAAPIAVDPATLLFTVAVGVTAGVIAGVAPAWSSSELDAHTALKEGAARATGDKRSGRLQNGLVVAEVGIAIALLSGAGLLLSSYAGLQAVDLGVDVERVQVAHVSLPDAAYPDAPSAARFGRALLDRLSNDPEVESAALMNIVPLGGSNTNGSVQVEGRPEDLPGEAPLVERRRVSPGAFRTLGIPILRGRDFDAGDREGGAPVMIVNQAFVDRFFPGEDPLGRRVRWETDELPYAEIVGVVADYRHDGPGRPVRRESYLPFDQVPDDYLGVVVKTKSEAPASDLIARAVRAVDPLQPVFRVSSLRDLSERKLQSRRATMLLLGAFALVAILLAALGIFGVVSHQTTRRTREVGIRVALGAGPWDVVGLVLRQSMAVVAWGVSLGVVLALVTGRLLGRFVNDVVSFDVGIYGLVALGVVLVGLIASFFPARRAAAIAPAQALRYE
ncbi:MAG: ABC transporter permease [Polyangiaceae bacterium]